MPLRSRAPLFRRAVGGIAAIAIVLLLWAALTKPGRTSPSPLYEAAFSLAEEGAQKALLELRNAEPKAGMEEPRERTIVYPNLKMFPQGGTGSCRVTVLESDSLTRLIEATGTVYNQYRTLAQRTLQVTVRRESIFELPVYARNGLFVAAGAEVESERSAENGVRAREAYGPRGSEGAGERFSPSRLAEKSPQDNPLPLLLPPWGLPSRKAVTLAGGDVLTLSEGGVLPTVCLLDSSTLVIDREVAVHITGPLILRGESQIVIACPSRVPDTDSRLRGVSLYIDEDVMVEEQAAIIVLAKSASSLSIIGMEQPSRITLSTREPLYATVYAPNSEIRIGPEAYLQGSVYGDAVHLLGGSRVRYAERSTPFHPPLGPFAVVSVRER